MITLATLAQATEQEVFDQVANHLLTQKERCAFYNDAASFYSCKYHYNGLKCAGGCLISDEEYERYNNPLSPNGNNLEGLIWKDFVDLGYAPPNHQELIRRLQIIHDSEIYFKHGGWKESLKTLAEEYRLNTKVLEQY